ncbi:hypothetical protein KKC65_02180 [Patescibacteria group bacterium]|nr:hypothetical protein [Patescibacteria group bacterium]
MKKEASYKAIYLTFGILVICLAIVSYTIAQWTEPGSPPPGGNVATPLNTSNIGQSKAGGLILNTGGATNGLIVDQGNVGIGTITPSEKLDVVGNVNITGNLQVDSASDICIDGGSCLSNEQVGFGDWDSTDSGQVGGTGIDLAKDTNYQAATDGFVVVSSVDNSVYPTNYVRAYTDSNPDPITLRYDPEGIYAWMGNSRWGALPFMMPVKKYDYWRVENVKKIYWMPFGN